MLWSYIPNIIGLHIKQGKNLKQTPETQLFIKTESMALFKYSLFHTQLEKI